MQSSLHKPDLAFMMLHNSSIEPVKSSQPLPILVRNRLIELIEKERLFPPGTMLPKEHELVKMLGVGRGTLREALRLLEQKGMITRRPGKGTLVKKEGFLVRNPLETNFSVTELIKSTNSIPGIRDVTIRFEKSNSDISNKLEIEVGTPLVVKDAVRTADGRPVVFTINHFPLSLITKTAREDYEIDHLLDKLCQAEVEWESLYNALENEYGITVLYGIAKVIPRVANSELSSKLEIDVGSPVLLIDQVNYTEGDKPIMYNHHYWVDGVVEFTILRRRSE